MPALPLPFLNDDICVAGEAEQLAAWLAPLFDASIADRIGIERLVRRDGRRVVLQGERFGTRRGWVQGSRYLILGPNGRPIAALNVTERKEDGQRKVAIASNIYVLPEYRRQGLARSLLEDALRDHPRLCSDGSLTELGAALFGYAPPSAPAPRRPKA